MQAATIEKRIGSLPALHGSDRRGCARPRSCAIRVTSFCTLAGSQREWRAVCIERCMHGSEGGVGMSS